jgi:hypothetical protein
MYGSEVNVNCTYMNNESPIPTPKDWDDKSMDIVVMDPMVIRGLTNEDGHLSFLELR